MAGSLIKIDEFTISSAVASVILGGGSSGSSGLNVSIDSTYNVYMVKLSNVAPTTDGATPIFRVTKSGTADTTANYDYTTKQLRTDSTFSNSAEVNINEWKSNDVGTNTGEVLNMISYLFNFNSSSEYSFITQEISQISSSGLHRGRQGGAVHTVASASDGMQFLMSSGNIASGTFTLYGLKK
jgi:hypothetical protein